ncbi:MAG: hypothetical protein H7831_04960 [Magnetococcus sp. WYHC-3]
MDHVPECGVAPIRHAYEKALGANMTQEEMEIYDKAGMVITDAKGALQLARGMLILNDKKLGWCGRAAPFHGCWL